VQSRYVLWNMTDVYGASNLLHKMSIVSGRRRIRRAQGSLLSLLRRASNTNSESSLIQVELEAIPCSSFFDRKMLDTQKPMNK